LYLLMFNTFNYQSIMIMMISLYIFHKWLGCANRITWTTFVYFLIGFVIGFGEIFLEYSWKSFQKIFKNHDNFLYSTLISLALKICQNMSFKKMKVIKHVILLFKSIDDALPHSLKDSNASLKVKTKINKLRYAP